MNYLVNRKLGWQVEEINEQVDEQNELRDNLVKKYTKILANREQKLEEMEVAKKQAMKVNENIIKETTQNMKIRRQELFNSETDKIKKH